MIPFSVRSCVTDRRKKNAQPSASGPAKINMFGAKRTNGWRDLSVRALAEVKRTRWIRLFNDPVYPENIPAPSDPGGVQRRWRTGAGYIPVDRHRAAWVRALEGNSMGS
jgi:hypothetical protein